MVFYNKLKFWSSADVIDILKICDIIIDDKSSKYKFTDV